MAEKKKTLSEEEQKELLLLKATYEMHCQTKKEALMRGKTKNVPKIDVIIKETYDKMANIDKDFARKCKEEFEDNESKFDLMKVIENSEDTSIYDSTEVDLNASNDVAEETKSFYEQFTDDNMDLYEMADVIEEGEEKKNELNPALQSNTMSENVFADDKVGDIAQYDMIPLPSKGECYKNKIESLPVAYLTASDENLITSPNLYESGNIIPILLKKKILNKKINIDELVSGDVDAIMVFLRGTSYGTDFPIVATDPKNGNKIETTVDLSKLKYKPFSLKGDENGFFDFKLPKTGANIKFKFLTKKDERLLQKINKSESQGIALFDVREAIDKINSALNADDKLNDTERGQIADINAKLEKWSNNLGNAKKNVVPYTKSITNLMEMQIVSINGNEDKKFIHEFVMTMPASDSLAFRRYVYDNQPGVDFEVDVERPVSQGGGTFKCFLEWDDYVFWHIA